MNHPDPPSRKRRLLMGLAVAVLLFLATLHTFVLVETYELTAFAAHGSCLQRGRRGCDVVLPPWAADGEHRTLRARFAGLVGQLPGLTLDAADAVERAAAGVLDALTSAGASEET